MKALKYLILPVFSLLLLLTACTGDTEPKEKPITVDRLEGMWKLSSAERDGDKTTSLEGTFFKFSNGKLVSNFTGEEVTSDFSFGDGKVTHASQDYMIESLSDTSMVVSTSFMDFAFKLNFDKSTD